jgi:hypothetical protein
LIQAARAELNYSSTTSPIDIMFPLVRQFKRVLLDAKKLSEPDGTAPMVHKLALQRRMPVHEHAPGYKRTDNRWPPINTTKHGQDQRPHPGERPIRAAATRNTPRG